MTRLPEFFVVGAQKAGTTALHEWLSGHPEVGLPQNKETHFFLEADKLSRGIEWYMSWFPDLQERELIGEVDPEYMFFEEVPERIRDLIPAPKLIFLFRHPLERAYSQYRMSLRRGFDRLSFGQALQAEPVRLASGDRESLLHHSYMARGSYTVQLERYLRTFPTAQFLFVDFDELFGENSGLAAYRRICEFLGIRSAPESVDRSRKRNPASTTRSTVVRDWIYGRSPVKSAIGKLIPSESLKLRMAQWLDRLNSRPDSSGKHDWRSEVPPHLFEQVSTETSRLAAATGLDLSGWIERN